MKALASGMTFIELILAVAVVGILAAIGFTQLNFGGFAAQQLAQAVRSGVNTARLEAIRQNTYVGIEFIVEENGSGAVRICSGVDVTATPLTCPPDDPDDANTIRRIDLGGSDLGRARLAAVTPASSLVFDRRGVMSFPIRRYVVTITDRAGANARTVEISPTGRAEIQR